MAILTVPQSNSGDDGDRLPVLKYDARAGRMFKMDRVETADGWQSNQTDITMQQPTFAVDFGSLEVGWVLFPKGAAPMRTMVPFGHPLPPRPEAVGTVTDDRTGKERPNNFKMGFRVKCAGKDLGGVRELMSNAGVAINAINALHDAFEAAPEAAAGKIPVVRFASSTPIKIGQSTNYQPEFTIVAWADRPAALGERTVPPPAAKAAPTAGNGASAAPKAAPIEDAIPF